MKNRFFPSFDGYIVTSRFGMRTLRGQTKLHKGIDLVATNDGKVGQTDKILAHTGGTVTAVGYGTSTGYYVKIQTAPGVIMVYYHLRKASPLKKGEKVAKGQSIGYMGKTGNCTGAHLHWGIQVDGQWIDPEPYLDCDYVAPPKRVDVSVPVLKKGTKGESVRMLQALLNARRYPLDMDGSFGGKTENALMCYQEDNGLAADGSCGAGTWASILN